MKNNKKLNLSEAASQVMGKGVMDMLGKSDMDATGRGSMTATPIAGAPVAAPVPAPVVPNSAAGAAMMTTQAAPETDENEETEETGEEEDTDVTEVEESRQLFRAGLISLLGEDVSQDLVVSLEAVFEAAVADRVEKQVSAALVELDENAQKYLENVTNSLVEKVDDYLEYVVEEWVTENAVAVEQGIKTTIAENFITGLKNLFENHYIDVPNEKYNVLDELYAQNRELQESLNQSIKEKIEMKKEIALTECAGIFVAETRDLADTQVSRLQNLMENISFGTPEEYREKLVTIKENYLRGAKVSAPVKTVDEDMTFSKTVNAPGTLVENYVSALGRLNKKL
jgi:hypothetical protein